MKFSPRPPVYWHNPTLAALCLAALFVFPWNANAATGFFGDGTGAAIFYVTDGSTAGEGTYRNVSNLNNLDYGDFIVQNGGSNTLMLRGGEGKTFKNSGGDVYGVTEYYRIYVDGAAAGSYTSFSLPFSADLGGGNQRWKKTDQNVNILSSLTQSGRYVVEYYWEQTGNQGTQPMNSGGSNYKTYFDLNYEINTSGTVTQNTVGGAATLSGNGTFVKKGTGTVQINANNSAYTGNAFIDQGTLEIQSGAFLTSGSITLGPEIGTSTGTLTISDSDGGTNVSNIIVIRASGAGSTIGATNSSGTNSYSGSIFLDGNATTSISSGGTLSFNGTEIDLKNQNLTVTGAGNTAISATVKNSTGTGKIIKQGTGTLTLSGANTLSGNTEIDEGTILVTGSLGSSAIYIGNGGGSFNNANAALTFNGSTASYSNNIQVNTSGGAGTRTLTKEGSTAQTLAGTLAANHKLFLNVNGTGGLTVSGATSGAGEIQVGGTGVLTFTNNNSYTGATVISSGATLQLGSGGTSGWVGSTSGITNNGTLVYNRSNDVSTTLVISGSGALTKNGSGQLTLNGTNTYTGMTAVNAGTLRLESSATIAGDITVSGGLLAFAASNLIADTASIIMTSGSIDLSTRSETINSMTMSGGTLRRAGTGSLTLSAASSFTGGTANFTAQTSRINTSGTTTLGNTAFEYWGTGTASGGLYLGGNILVNNNTAANFTNNGSGNLGVVNLNSATRTIDVGTGATLNMGWSVSGSSVGITKNGTGTLSLTANNSGMTGVTTVNSGILALGNLDALSGGTLDIGTSGSQSVTFTVAGTNTYNIGALQGSDELAIGANTISVGALNSSTTFGGNISGSGGLTKVGSGTLTLSGVNSYTGTTTINAGNITLSGGSAIADTGAVSLANTAGAILHIAASETISSLQGGGATGGNVSIAASQTLTVAETGSNTFSGIISGSGGLTKTGAGTLTLSGANTYTGTTTVNVGSLSLGASNVIGDSSAVTIGGGTLALGANNDTVGAVTMTSGSISGTGKLTGSSYALQGGFIGANLGTGTITVTSGTTILSGTADSTTININSGNLTLGAANRLADAAAVSVNATFNLGGFNETIGVLSGNSSGVIALGAGNLTTDSASSGTFAGGISGSGGLTKAGSGTLTLTGNNSYNGTTTVSAGTLTLNNAANNNQTIQGNILIDGGVLSYGSVDNQIADSSNVTITSGTLNLGARAETINSLIMGGGNLTYGNLTLGSSSSFTGGSSLRQTGSTTSQRLTTNGTLTLGDTTFTYSHAANDAGGGLVLNGDLVVNSNTTADFTNANVGKGRIILNDANRVFDIGSGANMNVAWRIRSVTDALGALTKNGSGTLTLTASNLYGNGTTINDGTLVLGTATDTLSNTGAVTINGGTLSIGANSDTVGTVTLAGGDITGTTGVLTGASYELQSGNVTAILGGTVAATKTTAGTVILSGANTYTGATIINAGTLSLGASDVISDSSAVTIGGGTLALGANNDTVGAVTMTSGSISGTGKLTGSSYALQGGSIGANLGTGTITVTSGTTTLSGTADSTTININSGNLTLGAANRLADTVVVSVNATFNLGGFNETIGVLSGNSSGVIALGAGTLTTDSASSGTFAGGISGTGGLTKAGSGTLTLTGNNSFSGTTTISAGTLTLTNAAVNSQTIQGNINIDGGELNLGLSNQIADSSNITLSTGNMTVLNRTESINAMSMSGGNLTISTGVLTLSAAGSPSNFTGGIVTISGTNGRINTNGTTTLGNATFDYGNATTGTNGLALGGDIVVNANSTANFTISGGATTRIILMDANRVFDIGSGGNMNVGWRIRSVNDALGALTKNGSGTLTLTAANPYGNGTTINEGTLVLGTATDTLANAGAVTINGGTLSLGANRDTVGAVTLAGGDITGTTGILTGASYALQSGNVTAILGGTSIAATKTTAGTVILSGANTYSGATTINAGTIVLSGTNTSSAITINSGGTLEGTGSAGGTTVASGGRISPGGSSVGTLATTTLTLQGGGGYTFSIDNVAGSAGTNWDLINVGGGSGTVTISATFGSPFTVFLNGNPTGWSDAGTYAWDIISSNNLSGFAADKFAVDLSGFTPSPTGSFFFTNSGTALVLNYAILGDAIWSGGTANWDTGFSPAVTTNANVFFTGAGGTATNNIASATLNTLDAITFNSTAGAYTLAANSGSAGHSATPLTLIGSVVNNSTANQTLNLALTFNANRVVDTASGNISIGGVIDGAGGLTKNGSSTLTLTQSNTLTGAIQVNAGTLATTGSGGFASTANLTVESGATYSVGVSDQINSLTSPGSLVLNAGTLTISSSANSSISGAISGSGSLTKLGSGTLTISNNNAGYSGETRLEGGVLEIGNDGALGTGNFLMRVNGVTIRSTDATDRTIANRFGTFAGTSAVYTFGSAGTGNLTFSDTQSASLGATRTFSINNSITRFDGVFTGGGDGITKTGTGTMVLTGNSTYTGTTTISAGTLQIGAGGGTGSIASPTIVNNSALLVDRTGSLSLSGNMSGTGTLTKNGSGTLVLSGSNTYSGATTLNLGTITLQSSNALGTGSLTQASAASLLLIDTTGTISNTISVYNVQASQSATLSGAITVNNATFDVDSGDTLTISNTVGGTGGVTKNGTGNLVLSGSNTYSGATIVNAGVLEAANANALGTNAAVTVNGGSLLVSSDDAINSKNLTLGSTASGNGSAASLVFSGTYNGTAGDLTLSEDSIIDLGTGSVHVHFADIAMGIYSLSIYNWTGTTLWGGGDGNNTDQFYIDRSLSGSELNNISFYSSLDNSSFVGTAFQLSGGSFNQQIIPVPEAETWLAASALLGGAGFAWLKRRRPRSGRAVTRV